MFGYSIEYLRYLYPAWCYLRSANALKLNNTQHCANAGMYAACGSRIAFAAFVDTDQNTREHAGTNIDDQRTQSER